jgi:uncharacterized hydrophobic protein (TIGR00341 family)
VALRLLIFAHGPEDRESFRHILEDAKIMESWTEASDDPNRLTAYLLVEQAHVERLVDALSHRFGTDGRNRITILRVDATVPRTPEAKPEPEGKGEGRLNREELVASVQAGTKLDSVFVAMAVLSAAVAAVGLVKGNVAVVIAAMVIAPLLGPNMGLALGTALADGALYRRGLLAGSLAIAAGFVVAFVLGLIVPFDPLEPEMLNRTRVDFGDLALALVSGVAGALSVTSARVGAIIGVMVAVAMMPPLVNAGLLAGAGHLFLASGAFLLFLTNIIAVNLAAVSTFVVQGVRPSRWMEARKARRATTLALIVWLVLLAALAVAIWFSGRR